MPTLSAVSIGTGIDALIVVSRSTGRGDFEAMTAQGCVVVVSGAPVLRTRGLPNLSASVSCSVKGPRRPFFLM